LTDTYKLYLYSTHYIKRSIKLKKNNKNRTKIISISFHEIKFVTELKEHKGETAKIAGPVWNTGPKYPVAPCNAG